MSDLVILDPVASVTAPPAMPAEAPAAPVEPAALPVETPAAAPGLLTPDAPAVATETPAVETPAAVPAVDPAAAEKPPEAVADPAAATEPAVEPPALPTYEPFTLPEGSAVDNEVMGKFTGVIGELGLDQAGGQRLTDLYSQEILPRLVEQMAAHQQEVFQETQREWVRQFEADPELGRNRRDTTLREANTAIRWAFGLGIPGEKLTPEEQTAREAAATKYYTEMSYTGFQNHPENVRAWVRVHNVLKKYLAEPSPPPPGTPPAGVNLRPADRRYGTNGAAR